MLCLRGLRKHISELQHPSCPTCRGPLPEGKERLYEDARALNMRVMRALGDLGICYNANSVMHNKYNTVSDALLLASVVCCC